MNTGGPVLRGDGIRYELSEKTKAIAFGGLGAVHRLVRKIGLPEAIDEGLRLLNRGGVPGSAAEEGDPLHGIYRFKHRLGTTPVSCTSGTVVLDRVRDYLMGLQHRLRRGIAISR